MLLQDILELNALKEPDRPALVAGGETYSFGQLHERAQRLAVALGDLAQPGERIASPNDQPTSRRRHRSMTSASTPLAVK